jgi:hypothetical protein
MKRSDKHLKDGIKCIKENIHRVKKQKIPYLYPNSLLKIHINKKFVYASFYP